MSVTVRIIGKPGKETTETITPEMSAEFESGLEACKNPDSLLIVAGSDSEREEYLKTVRLWGVSREKGRVTLRLYNHPDPEPNSTYYRLMPFIRGD